MDKEKFITMSVLKINVTCEALTKIIEFSKDNHVTPEVVEFAKDAMKKIDPKGLSPWAKRIKACG